MKPKLYCDIDSTLNTHRERIKRNTIGGWPGEAIDPKAFTREEVMKDQALPGALDALKKLSEHFEITYLTARMWDWPEGTITKDWLEREGFPIDHIVVVGSMEEKINFINANPCDLFIDDFSIYQERLYTALKQSVIDKITVPFEIFRGDWQYILDKHLKKIPNGELFFEQQVRNLNWWKANKHLELTTRVPYYEVFLNSLGFNPEEMRDKVVAEVGCGPTGGILQQMYSDYPVHTRIFIDCFMNAMKNLNMVEWPNNAIFIEKPFEDLSGVQDNSIDLVLSFNALDHGWDIEAALSELFRVSKAGYIAFDCKNNTGPEHDKLDHYQPVNYNRVKAYVESRTDIEATVQDLTKLAPKFHFEHNWGYHIAAIKYKKK